MVFVGLNDKLRKFFITPPVANDNNRITCGALALVTALFARQQIEKKKLRPELAMGLK